MISKRTSGHFFKTQRKSKLAVVAIGYADGGGCGLSGRVSAAIAPYEGAISPKPIGQ